MICAEREIKFREFIKSFAITDWNSEWKEWCKYPIPFITSKFGNRPLLRPVSIDGWWQWDSTLIEKTVKENTVLYLKYGFLEYHIKLLFDACKKINEPRIIVSEATINHPVPSNVKIIYSACHAYHFSRVFDDTNIKPVYKRQTKNLKYPFMIMAFGHDHGRPRLMLMLEQLGLLKNSLYSSGHIISNKLLFPEDPLGINSVLTDIEKTVIGKKYIKFNVKKNLNIIPNFINQSHFYVAGDTDGLYYPQAGWCVSEKHLWGYTTTTPVKSIWCDNTTEQMKRWGYRTNNISKRKKEETIQDTIERWCKEILFLYQITLNNNWSQSWQEKQQEDGNHNFQLTKNLHKIISLDIEKQIDELPIEFKNL